MRNRLVSLSIFVYLFLSLSIQAAPAALPALKKALQPYLGQQARPYYLIHDAKYEGSATLVDFSFRAQDGRYRALANIQDGVLKGLETIVAPEPSHPGLLEQLAGIQEGELTITGVVPAPTAAQADRRLLAFEWRHDEEHAPDRFLAWVTADQAGHYRPVESDRAYLKELSWVMAVFQARELAERYNQWTENPAEKFARLEVELRLAGRSSRDLQLESSESTPVGFYPPFDFSQYSLSSVLSDNAIYVTLTEGGYRLEDFN